MEKRKTNKKTLIKKKKEKEKCYSQSYGYRVYKNRKTS